jgi:protein phosphatase methylesterase 1
MTYIVRLTWRESLQDRALNSLQWTSFFDQELYLQRRVNDLDIVHHVYLTSPTNSGPLFVMHHGAGSSGLSFANCAAEIRKILPNAGILSADARDHGSTSVKRASEDGEADPETARLDLSLDTLNQDLLFVIRETQAKMGWETLPDIVLVGHSLGGAVITDVAKKGELGGKLLAYAVLDVVEGGFQPISGPGRGRSCRTLGSAMDALQSMETYLSTRPSRFPSLPSGIEWQYVHAY